MSESRREDLARRLRRAFCEWDGDWGVVADVAESECAAARAELERVTAQRDLREYERAAAVGQRDKAERERDEAKRLRDYFAEQLRHSNAELAALTPTPPAPAASPWRPSVGDVVDSAACKGCVVTGLRPDGGVLVYMTERHEPRHDAFSAWQVPLLSFARKATPAELTAAGLGGRPGWVTLTALDAVARDNVHLKTGVAYRVVSWDGLFGPVLEMPAQGEQKWPSGYSVGKATAWEPCPAPTPPPAPRVEELRNAVVDAQAALFHGFGTASAYSDACRALNAYLDARKAGA